MTLAAADNNFSKSAPGNRESDVVPSARADWAAEYSGASDYELLAAARTSDGRAFAELCCRHTQAIKSRVFRMLRNREDTEDVLQEAIYKAFVHLDCFRGTCSFSVWLTQIAINSALMLMRKRRSRWEIPCEWKVDQDERWETWEFPDRSLNAEQIYIRHQAIERMAIAVDRLPARYRDLVRQFHGTDQSLQETAGKLGLKLGTAKSRLLRARLRIRSSLEKQRISFADACR
jgi:RNA polymerase sigma-70 factor (ECF subfamily)